LNFYTDLYFSQTYKRDTYYCIKEEERVEQLYHIHPKMILKVSIASYSFKCSLQVQSNSQIIDPSSHLEKFPFLLKLILQNDLDPCQGVSKHIRILSLVIVLLPNVKILIALLFGISFVKTYDLENIKEYLEFWRLYIADML
jgi:hypothetical protein